LYALSWVERSAHVGEAAPIAVPVPSLWYARSIDELLLDPQPTTQFELVTAEAPGWTTPSSVTPGVDDGHPPIVSEVALGTFTLTTTLEVAAFEPPTMHASTSAAVIAHARAHASAGWWTHRRMTRAVSVPEARGSRGGGSTQPRLRVTAA
jgi:hypothetical protein